MFRLVAALAVFAALTAPLGAQTRTVAIVQFEETGAFAAVREGIEAGLAESGFNTGQNLEIVFESAGGDAEALAGIASQLVAEEPDVIVPISTPAASAVASAAIDVPVIFAAVTDPVGAELLGDPMSPGGNVTGVTDLLPISEHFGLIREVLPQIAMLGVLYNPDQHGAGALMAKIAEFAPGSGVAIVEAQATEAGEVEEATRSLVGEVEAIYVPTDKVIGGSLAAAVAVAEEEDLPLFSSDVDAVSDGAIAALSFDYQELGRQAGALVARILKGEKPGNIPVVAAEETRLVVNPGAAERMGVALSPGFVALADEVIE